MLGNVASFVMLVLNCTVTVLRALSLYEQVITNFAQQATALRNQACYPLRSASERTYWLA